MMATGSSQFEKVKQAIASSADTTKKLGDIVFWRLERARIERNRLLALWQSAQLNPGLVPDANTPEKALRTAVDECQVGLKAKGIQLVAARTGKDKLIFTVQQQHTDSQGDVTFKQEAKVTLDRASSLITADKPTHTQIQAILQAQQELLISHTTDDVRKAITNALHSFSCAALRDGGGVYWVPEPSADPLYRLADMVPHLGHSRMYLIPVYENEKTSEALTEVAQGSLEDELRKLQKEIADFVTAPPERVSTLEKRFDSFKELRARAELYKLVLGTTVQGLEENIQQMSDTLSQLIAQKS